MLKNRILYYGFLVFSFFILINEANSQIEPKVPQSDPMKSYMKQYQEFTNTNKNALALEVLQKYSILQEVALNKERESLTKEIQIDFLKSQLQRSESIKSKEAEIAKLKSENEDIDRENLKMTRNTLLFFGILIGISVLILLNRFRALAAVKGQFELSKTYLQYSEKFSGDSERNNTELKRLNQSFQSAQKQIDEASTWLDSIIADKQNSLNKAATQLVQNTKRIISLLVPATLEETGIKQNTDLNQLIDEVTDQAFGYYTSETSEFSCAVVRDLEKILPKIDIIPEDIRLVIFNLLINAFDSINEKKSNAPKGYQPKVTISTRKLPRFVQIRIKDNGTGIGEKEPKEILKPFYSNKKSEKNPGLGLSESARIIQVIHKGELIIESDPGNGSDFIIRFTTLTLS